MMNTKDMNKVNTDVLAMVSGGNGPLGTCDPPCKTGTLETCDPPCKTGTFESCDPPYKTGSIASCDSPC